MALSKQAKVITPKEQQRLLDLVSHSRHPERARVMVLLSFRAGLRAKEIAGLTWAMVTDASGAIGDVMALPNVAAKGDRGGREIPMHHELRTALALLQAMRGERAVPADHVIYSERDKGYGPASKGYGAAAVAIWFLRRYRDIDLAGASSHSGRRTFITAAARKVSEAGGSLRDVQELAGHSSLSTTQRYIEGDTAAKRKLIALI